jgi:hypothetical protein
MEVAIRSLDDIAPYLQGQRGDDISCYVLESLAVECFRAWNLVESRLRHLLGFEARFEVHAFLKVSGKQPDAYALFFVPRNPCYFLSVAPDPLDKPFSRSLGKSPQYPTGGHDDVPQPISRRDHP